MKERRGAGKQNRPKGKTPLRPRGDLSHAEQLRRRIIKDYNQLLLTHDEVVERLASAFEIGTRGNHERNTSKVNSTQKLYQWIAARSLRFTAHIAKEMPHVYESIPKR